MYIYIYIHLWDLSTLYVMKDLWPLFKHNITYHVYHLIPQHLLTNFKEKGEWSKRRRQNAKIKITLCRGGSKVSSGGACKLGGLPAIRHKFVSFDVTSLVEIDCARSSLCLLCLARVWLIVLEFKKTSMYLIFTCPEFYFQINEFL